MYRVIDDPSFKLYEGSVPDCLDELENEIADFIWTDPPYFLSNGGTTVRSGKRTSVNKGNWDKSRGTIRLDSMFQRDWIHGVQRLMKWPRATIMISGSYHSIYHCGYALQMESYRILNSIQWYKPNASPNLGCRCLTASHETIIWASLGKKARHCFNYEAMKNGDWHTKDILKNDGKQMRDIWAINTPRKGEKAHGGYPTQKPLDLLKRCIEMCSDPGDTVFDPFCGSGTTGIAAYELGRKFIGIDNNVDALKLTEARFRDLKKPLDIEKESE